MQSEDHKFPLLQIKLRKKSGAQELPSVDTQNKNKSPQTWGSNLWGEGLGGNESYLDV